MKRTLTYKYRLSPTKKQSRILEHTLDICRILYNSCLADRRNFYQKTGKGLSRIDQQVILRADKKKVVALKGIHSQVLQDVLFRVDRAFQAFFRRVREKNGKAGYPRFKSDGVYDSICYPQEPGFMLTPRGLRLSKIGTVKIKLHRQIIGTPKTCIVRRDGNHWYACISVEFGPAMIPVPVKAIGLDVGIKALAYRSDGEAIENPKFLIASEKKLIRRQRQLSSKKIGSHNRKKAVIKVAALHRKIRNRRANFHHQVSRNLVNTYGFIVVEDLKIKNLLQHHFLAKSISDAGWGQFIRFLAYKAENAGCTVDKVAPHHTSIICSTCGERVPKTLMDRVHHCPSCGLTLDRDHNAAINILNRAGTARINAWGEATILCPSMIQEALSVRAR